MIWSPSMSSFSNLFIAATVNSDTLRECSVLLKLNKYREFLSEWNTISNKEGTYRGLWLFNEIEFDIISIFMIFLRYDFYSDKE